TRELAAAAEELDRELRSSWIRSLRALIDKEGHPLPDQDLAQAKPGSPTVRFERVDGRITKATVTLGPGGPVLHAQRDHTLPGPLSLLPPLIAILLAILLRRPVLSLICGVIGGAWVVYGLAGGGLGSGVLHGTPAVFTNYLWGVLKDEVKYEIVAFIVAMLSMVGIMTRAGGIQGLMDQIARIAGNTKRTRIATYLMGLAVFFDDYANTILVGATMRPLSDHFKVAREKLAYIVDSTAAPVAGLSLFSTWIAFEVSTFQSALPDAGLTSAEGYSIFLQTLPFRFYCLFTLVLVALVVFLGRDFGPMLSAERRAQTGLLLRDGARPMVGKAATELEMEAGIVPRAHVALIPLGLFVGVTLISILVMGGAFTSDRLSSFQGWTQILYDGSGSKPLMYGALAGLIAVTLLAVRAGLRSGIWTAAASSLMAMGVAIAILYLAWMLAKVCEDLGTSSYLSVQLGDSLPPLLLPTILFLLSALIAFSTGSSWSTMVILLPLVVGLAYRLGTGTELGGHLLMVMSIGAVLEGSIFGDHCSPISDTTVMSSIASASDHIDHVRTQLPYALDDGRRPVHRVPALRLPDGRIRRLGALRFAGIGLRAALPVDAPGGPTSHLSASDSDA
ncbi:MAG: Na+/H+ antiporter NhaC family protein, partial [Planctomycetota bacterium]